jgi:hypothetical protein
MYAPVSPAEFYDSPAGQDFQTLFIMPQFRPNNLGRVPFWLTGNYNPDTGLCTVYRAVDDTRKEAFLASGAITSRVVEYFGDNDMATAINALHDAADGNIPTDVVRRLQPEYEKAEQDLEEAVTEDPAHAITLGFELVKVSEFLSGKVNRKTRATVLETATLLETATKLGKEAFIAAARQASKDDVPALTNATRLDTLMHSSIHTTTSHAFAASDVVRTFSRNILQIDFKPGSLPIAPRLGYVDGAYAVRATDPMPGTDEEWYGIGQLTPGEDVTISLLDS